MTAPRENPARRIARFAAALAILLVPAASIAASEPAVTVLSDFDDDSVAARIADTQNLSAANCKLGYAGIPARSGQRSQRIEIGATQGGASLGCALRFRMSTPFVHAETVAIHGCIYEGEFELVFRVRDAAGRLYETKRTRVTEQSRFVRIEAGLKPGDLTRVDAEPDAPAQRPESPLQIEGYRISIPSAGRQIIYLDDLEVVHRVDEKGLVRGNFEFDRPTHLYEPGSRVRARLILENLSRRRDLRLGVDLAWVRSDGHRFGEDSVTIALPPRGEKRSYHEIEVDQRIRAPGLYRLVAQARSFRWTAPAVYETSIAVVPSNRSLPRGRATFFGLRSNSLREPTADQDLEIELARELGAQIFALETPWRLIEPEAGAYALDRLTRFTSRLEELDIAICLTLTEPPDWLADSDAERLERQTLLLEALVSRFGRRIGYFQALSAAGDAEAIAARTAQLQARVSAMNPDAVVLDAPVRVDGEIDPPVDLAALIENRGVAPVLETNGDPAQAAALLAGLSEAHGISRLSDARWLHRATPRLGAGHIANAFAVLRLYVEAAAAGVGGVFWFDLRDDTSDPRFHDAMSGLVSRDYSPKNAAIGFASTVGMLHGLRYVGPLRGAPQAFDTALFIAGTRQVAVLQPKPGHVLPAVIAPIVTVEGDISVFDFERRARSPIESAAPTLVTTLPRPFFVVLQTPNNQKDPKLSLAPRPWIRVPRAVYCAASASFPLEIDAPFTLNRRSSNLRITLPSGAPVRSSLNATRLGAPAGEHIRFDVLLTRTTEQPIEPFSFRVRLLLEGDNIELPVLVRPLTEISPIGSASTIFEPKYRIANLIPAKPHTRDPDRDSSPPVTLHAGYQSRKLVLAIPKPELDVDGVRLLIGVAGLNGIGPTEVEILRPWTEPTVKGVFGTPDGRLERWRARAMDSDDPACRVDVPVAAFGLDRFTAQTHVLLSVRLVRREGGGASPGFGAGLDGSRLLEGYERLGLIAEE